MTTSESHRQFGVTSRTPGKVNVARVDYEMKYLVFDGKRLHLKGVPRGEWEQRKQFVESEHKTLLLVAAVSGLKKNNAKIGKLIKAGRKLRKEFDYTDPVFQGLDDVGPIPEGVYELRLVAGAPFEKTGGGWGVGGWRLHPVDDHTKLKAAIQNAANRFLGNRLHLTRDGFFLHQDGGSDGTSGCIGIGTEADTLRVRNELTKYQKDNHEVIYVFVQYPNVRPIVHALEGPEEAFATTSEVYTVTGYGGTPTEDDKKNVKWAIQVGDGPVRYLGSKYTGEQITLPMDPSYAGKTIRVMPYFVTPVEETSIETKVLKITHLVLAFEGYNSPIEINRGLPIPLDTKNDRVVDIVNRSISGTSSPGEQIRGQAYATDGIDEQAQLFARKFISDNLAVARDGRQLSKVVVYGYSMGGDTAVELAQSLGTLQIDLLITIDASTWQNVAIDRVVPTNVRQNLNYWTKNSGRSALIGKESGGKNRAIDTSKTTVHNYPCHEETHASISLATKEDSIHHIRKALGLPVVGRLRYTHHED